VFVIPVGPDRYELYSETAADPESSSVDAVPATGLLGRLRLKFAVMLRAAEEREHLRRQPRGEQPPPAKAGFYRRLQERAIGWVAQRIAEQRLLWNLRRQTTAVAVHPEDMSFEQVQTLIRRALHRDYERHRVWLVIDTLGLIGSGPLALVPGPNFLAYYFAFRVVGHWLSMRGAAQGLDRVTWTSRPCPPLVELRDAVMLEMPARYDRVADIAARLRLPQLTTFVDRVARAV
jgi:hypothetical protein